MNASNITPSSPIRFANGFKKVEVCIKIEVLLICILAIIQINSPAGIAIITALPSTNKVLSNIDLIITLPICGFLYGGSSSIKEDGIPFKRVCESILDTRNVRSIPNIITAVKISMDIILLPKIIPPVKNMVIIAIKVGNLPLHGMKLLVMIAISRSLLESIILAPVTPTALHPNPMQMGTTYVDFFMTISYISITTMAIVAT